MQVQCGQTFPRTSRLTKGIEFQRVFDKPSVSADGCFKVLARENNHLGNRLGLAVSRKVDRKAVGRNRIKRVVRESFRNHVLKAQREHQGGHQGEQESASGSSAVAQNPFASLDFVVLPHYNCKQISSKRLAQSLDKHWKRLIKDLAQ